MKVIVDVGVGALVEELLRELGHDVIAVRDLNPSMPDTEILTHALSEGRLVITMDKDFGELVYRCGRLHSGVLLLRLESATGTEKAGVVRRIFEKYGEALLGCFSVFAGGFLRIRDAAAGQQGDADDDASRRG